MMGWHIPAEHPWPWQLCPQRLQLKSSVWRAAQLPPQSVYPVLQV
jgi:hypothetical protein